MTSEIHLRTCPLCEAMCGLEVTVTDEQVTLIRGHKDDVWSKGYLCPKGTTLGALHHDPDRIRTPMVREGDEWREVTWDEAFERCAELMGPVLAEHGIEAVTAYLGNPLAHAFDLGRYVGILIGMSGIPMVYSAGTVDQWPKNLSSYLMYGGMWKIPVPDLQRTELMVLMGANPHASQGSLMACADVIGELDRIRDEGGTVIVVDPRRTGTADHADEWLPIVPGTDAALLLAVVNVLFADGLVDLGGLAGWIDPADVDAVAALAADVTPEAVESTTGIAAERIRALAHQLAGTERAVVYGRIGTCNQEFGTLASWLVDVVNILTRHFDTPGGLMFPTPSVWSVAGLPLPDLEGGEPNFGRWRSRVRGAPEVLGQVPVSCLAEEIATPGPGQIRALITVAGNPVISTPGAGDLDAALPLLDCMISVDNQLNETTRHAHVLLPGLSPLEQPHHDELIWLFAVRSAAKWSDAIFDAGDRPREWEIMIRLAGICAGIAPADLDVHEIDDGFFDVLASMVGVDPAVARAGSPGHGPERLLDLTLRTGPFGDRYGEDPDGLTLAKVKAAPDGIDLGPMVPRIPEILATPEQRIRLAPPHITDDVPRLRARLAAGSTGPGSHDGQDDGRSDRTGTGHGNGHGNDHGDRPGDGSGPHLRLVSRRDVRSNNSWMHNVPVLAKGRNRCTLQIHPDDARACGVDHGSTATIRSEVGRLDVEVEITDGIMAGVVCLPHGWGHDRPGTRQSVASRNPGVNNNLLAPGHLVDVPSGNAALNGIPVTVAPAG